ncbi:MAG: hypothetical protein LQ346_000778 [Caloplaca aetnensis]|nr:MAG: hypothetical protein LQ346_000778 [Caloplaca aetnensis]
MTRRQEHITICSIWFDGIDEDTLKEDSSVVKANCPKGAKGEKNWEQISFFKGIKSFTMIHEMTYLNYTTNRDGVPASMNNRSLDYAYGQPDCKSLRDGNRRNAEWYKEFTDNVCPATKSFRNADSLAFVASGIYWEGQCDKIIAIESEAGVTENYDPALNDDQDAEPDTPDNGDDGIVTTSTAGLGTTAPPAIGPLTSCSLVEYMLLFSSISTTGLTDFHRTTIMGTIAGGPQTYCTGGSIMAGINTETSGNLVYSVCAGDPYPTVATSTIADVPQPTTTETTPPAETPDLSSLACTSCTGTLGASDCSADDDQCLIDQCRNDDDCQTCGIDCDSFGS